jgi:hypothetical protein
MKPSPTFADLLIEAGRRLNRGEPHHRVMSALGFCATQTRWKSAPKIARILYGLIEREVTARESSSPWAFEHREDADGSEALRHVMRRTFA